MLHSGVFSLATNISDVRSVFMYPSEGTYVSLATIRWRTWFVLLLPSRYDVLSR